MAKDMFNDKEFTDSITEPFHEIAEAINKLADVLFDTLGSYETGQALKAVSAMSGTFDRIADALEDISN